MSLGFTEIILIVLFILIVFGAKRIPELARAMGRASYEFKKAKNALSTEGQELMNAAEKAAAKEEKQEKARIMEERLLAASLVPLHMMEKAAEMLEFLEILAEKGSRMAVSDVGVAVQFARTALTGAIMNVYINTKSMKNREKAEELNTKARELIKNGTKKADEIYEKVLEQLT